MKLINQIASDGSRQFAELPQAQDWDQLREHLKSLAGVSITDFLTDHVTEAWIDFSYSGHSFSINNQFGEYWFFVDDPNCHDKILEQVVVHCERFLNTGS
jgi:hypothetical protein